MFRALLDEQFQLLITRDVQLDVEEAVCVSGLVVILVNRDASVCLSACMCECLLWTRLLIMHSSSWTACHRS